MAEQKTDNVWENLGVRMPSVSYAFLHDYLDESEANRRANAGAFDTALQAEIDTNPGLSRYIAKSLASFSGENADRIWDLVTTVYDVLNKNGEVPLISEERLMAFIEDQEKNLRLDKSEFRVIGYDGITNKTLRKIGQQSYPLYEFIHDKLKEFDSEDIKTNTRVDFSAERKRAGRFATGLYALIESQKQVDKLEEMYTYELGEER